MQPDVHLWMLFTDDARDTALLDRYSRLLTQDERARQMRFYFERDRHRFLLTRALVRTVLSRYAEVEPGDWRFVPDAYGRPCISNTAPGVDGLSFNVSHTQGLILLAVARLERLGVDTEHLQARTASQAIAEKYFAPEEVGALLRLPESERERRFYELWTLKEAYVKACGRGLSMPLRQFAFELQKARLKLRFQPTLQDSPPRWQVWQFSPSAEHVAAVCAARLEGVQQRLIARKIVPLVEERAVELSSMRQLHDTDGTRSAGS